MPRKNKRLGNYKKIYDIRNYQKVSLTRHVIERSKSRRDDLKGLSDNKIRSKIVHEIRHSKLVGFDNNKEHCTFNGYVYVVKKEEDRLVAVTVLLSEKRKERRKLNNKCIA